MTITLDYCEEVECANDNCAGDGYGEGIEITETKSISEGITEMKIIQICESCVSAMMKNFHKEK